MMRSLAVAALSLVCAVPAAFAQAGAERPLARVGDDVVSPDELRAEFVRRHGGHAKFLGGEEEIRAFLKIVIDRRLLLQEAYRLGLDALPEVRSTAERIAEKKSIERLIKEEIDDRSKVTEEEIRAAWESRTTELYQVLQIVVESREEAAAVARELEAGADFGELARVRSIARSKLRGGGLGTIGWGVMSIEWEQAVFPLQPGQTSPPFETEEGWEIVRMVSRTPAEKPDYDTARARIEGILAERTLEARRAQFSEELWTKYGARLSGVLELTPAALSALLQTVPETVLVTWEGGALDLATFARGLDLAALGQLPVSKAQRQLDDLLRRTVNDALVRREVVARKMAERPDIAAEVRTERENLMERILYADYVLKGVSVSDAEVRAWYDGHPEQFRTPERRKMAHLVTATREEGEALRARIERGEGFEDLVRQYSTDPATSKKGGDLGWITKEQVPPEFAAVLGLASGEISAPLQSQYGWHLMRVEAIDPPRPMPFEEASGDLRKRLLEKKKSEERAKWVKALREATPVSIDEEAVVELARASNKA